jgi:DNA-binding transcriptional LysR family regulator
VALSGAAERLHVAAVPLPLPSVRIQMLWHRRTARDPAHTWLRARVAELFRAL